MTATTMLRRGRAWGPAILVALLVVGAAAGACLWIAAAPPPPILSDPQDRMEQTLDGAIVGTMADVQMGNRIDIAVQNTTILLGLTATLLTATTTPVNTERLKIATVSVTALKAALIDVQATFHLRENIHTDAKAFTALVVLAADDIDKRDRLAEAGTDAAALRRDTVDTLTRIRSEHMLSLTSIGAGSPAGRRERRGGE